jgi:hypothetical protein
MEGDKSMLKKLACAIFVCVVLPLGGASASGPTYAIHHPNEPAVAADMGRIYFYRSSGLLGFAMQPAVKIDGTKVGDSEPGNYFYVDRPPGTYTISTATEAEETVSVPLAAGQTVYVKTRVGMGFIVYRVSPEIVDNTQATDDIKDCDFVGTDAPAAATASATTPAPPSAATATTTPAPSATQSTAPADSTTPTPPKN